MYSVTVCCGDLRYRPARIMKRRFEESVIRREAASSRSCSQAIPPRRAALPSTRLEGRSRLALPSPPLYRTTRARHGGRGLPRLFPGRRCALRPASCCLSAAAATNPTRDADTRPHLVRQASHTSRQIAPTQQVPHPSPSPQRHVGRPSAFEQPDESRLDATGAGLGVPREEGDFQRLRVARHP